MKPQDLSTHGLAAQDLATRIATPTALANAAGCAGVSAWLDEIGDSGEGRELRKVTGAHPRLRGLIEAVASCSPYLWDLIRADPARLVTIVTSDPDARLAACVAEASARITAIESDAAAMQLVRTIKAEAALLIALADIGGIWDMMQVTRALTQVADAAVGAALRYVLGAAARAGRLAPLDPADLERGCGLIVLAMGKMGAERTQLFERHRPHPVLRP